MKIQVLDEKDPGQIMDQVPVKIVVIGTGGGGSNAVNGMIRRGIKGVKFIVVNTDSKDLLKSPAETKLQIGAKLTKGQGAGGKPEVGEKAAQEDEELIREALKDAEMVFITAGMGGGTGTGSAPVIARIAREKGALTVAVVTKPFGFEGSLRMRHAEEGIAKLREAVDTLIVIPNQKLINNVDRSTSCMDAFAMADDVLRQGVQGISDIIVETGTISVDFADITTVMKDQGDALMSIGFGAGDNRVMEAVTNALDNPLLEDTSIKGATRMLIYVAGGASLTMVEYDEVTKNIEAEADPNALIIAGLCLNPEMEDRIRVTVIATGFGKAASPVEKKPAAEKAPGEERELEAPADETISAEDLEGMLRPAPLKGPFLSRRNPGSYDEVDLDIPPTLRYRSFAVAEGRKAYAPGANAARNLPG